MSNDYFNEKKSKIIESLKYSYENDNSDFYKNFWGNSFNLNKIDSYKDFQKIPFLTRDEIIKCPLPKRVFVPQNDISYYVLTSGTSNKGLPLVLAHNKINYEDIDNKDRMINTDRLKELGAGEILLLFPPLSGPNMAGYNQFYNGRMPTMGNLGKLNITALMSKEIGIDAIATSPTILLMLTKELQKINFDFSNIKYLNLSGESCSRQKFEMIKTVYSNAFVDFCYGAAECSNGIRVYGDRCNEIKNEDTNIFHLANDHYFIEILDDSDNPVEEGSPGNIVVTDLFTPKASPLVRYKIGDYGRIYKKECKCGQNYFIELMGRSSYDLLKVQGTLVHNQAIAGSLDEFKDKIEPGFQMHVYEEMVDGMPKPRLELYIISKNDDGTLENEIKKTVSRKLKMAPGKMLSDLVNMGVFQPLDVKVVGKWPIELGPEEFKHKSIISHVK